MLIPTFTFPHIIFFIIWMLMCFSSLIYPFHSYWPSSTFHDRKSIQDRSIWTGRSGWPYSLGFSLDIKLEWNGSYDWYSNQILGTQIIFIHYAVWFIIGLIICIVLSNCFLLGFFSVISLVMDTWTMNHSMVCHGN